MMLGTQDRFQKALTLYCDTTLHKVTEAMDSRLTVTLS